MKAQAEVLQLEPFLYQPLAPLPTGVSLNRRSFSQFNIRGLVTWGIAPSAAGGRHRRPAMSATLASHFVATAGRALLQTEESFRGSASRAPKRNLGSRPTTSRMRRRSGVDALGFTAPSGCLRFAYMVPSLMHPSAHTQQDSSRAVATLATTGLIRRAANPCLRLTSRATPSAAWLAVREGTASS